MVSVTHFSDPGCPWAYSASPAHAVLRWRFGDQLEWRLVTIGLTEQAEQYVQRGYTPAGSARGYLRFRRRGMPFATQPRPRVAATARACRAIVATRLQAPELELAVFRALQFGWFTTPLVLDEPADLAEALATVEGLDADAILDPTLRRTPPAEDPLEVLEAMPYGLVTAEVAAVMAPNNEAPDRDAAESALVDLVARGCVIRQGLGDDALWQLGPHAREGSDPGQTGSARARFARHTARHRAARR